MAKEICKYCGYEIETGELAYEVDGGYVHDDCADEYLDDIWDGLPTVNKLQLFNMSDRVYKYNTLSEGEIWDRQHDDYVEEKLRG